MSDHDDKTVQIHGHPELGISGGGGVSLRDYFAAKSAHSLIVSKEGPDYYIGHYEATADEAYRMADAMLKARERS